MVVFVLLHDYVNVNQQCVVYSSQSDTGYVSYIRGHLHNRVNIIFHFVLVKCRSVGMQVM